MCTYQVYEITHHNSAALQPISRVQCSPANQCVAVQSSQSVSVSQRDDEIRLLQMLSKMLSSTFWQFLLFYNLHLVQQQGRFAGLLVELSINYCYILYRASLCRSYFFLFKSYLKGGGVGRNSEERTNETQYWFDHFYQKNYEKIFKEDSKYKKCEILTLSFDSCLISLWWSHFKSKWLFTHRGNWYSLNVNEGSGGGEGVDRKKFCQQIYLIYVCLSKLSSLSIFSFFSLSLYFSLFLSHSLSLFLSLFHLFLINILTMSFLTLPYTHIFMHTKTRHGQIRIIAKKREVHGVRRGLITSRNATTLPIFSKFSVSTS